MSVPIQKYFEVALPPVSGLTYKEVCNEINKGIRKELSKYHYIPKHIIKQVVK